MLFLKEINTLYVGRTKVRLCRFLFSILFLSWSLKLKPIILNNSKQELNFQRLNYSKIQHELKWKPKTDIDIGIKKTIEWYIRFYNFLKK